MCFFKEKKSAIKFSNMQILCKFSNMTAMVVKNKNNNCLFNVAFIFNVVDNFLSDVSM